jgi:hypothetical protein
VDYRDMMLSAMKRRLPWIGRLYRERDALRAGSQDFSRELTGPLRDFVSLMKPMRPMGLRKIRVGRPCDGGYVMVDDFQGILSALSVGVGDDVSWDLDIAARGIEVLQFDPTVDGPPAFNSLFHFERIGLGATSRAGFATLHELLSKVEGTTIAKIDIEGDEWDVLASVGDDDLQRIRQLVVEFHSLERFVDKSWRAVAIRALTNVARHFQSVHIHGNNCLPFAVVGGMPIPRALEVTFLRRADHAFEADMAEYPTELDFPNNVECADFYLGRWN